MVAPKRGRGAKAQAAKAKPAATPVEEQPMEAETTETVSEVAEGNNGNAELTGQAETTEESAEQAESTEASQEATPEVKEEKVEPGKILVENLPSSYLFNYQDKLKELFSKYGEVNIVKRGPIIVTELTTTPTLSAIVEFKNKDSVEKALAENGTVLDGSRIEVIIEQKTETSILVGVPYEASTEYVKLLFAECGEIAQVLEFSKTKYKILRVSFASKDSVEKALKLDRELRINGFLVTVSKYRDDTEGPKHDASKSNKRTHSQAQNRSQSNANNSHSAAARPPPNIRGRGGAFNAPRGNFRGGRGRGGFPGRGGAFPRGGGYSGINNYMPPGGFMAPRPGGFMNDGQRPNKRLRQM